MRKEATYIGDGVYVRYDGNAVCIYTSNGIEESNHIYVEFNEARSLLRFLKNTFQLD